MKVQPLIDNAVEVWIVDLRSSDDQVQCALQILSADERQRAEKFRFDLHRNRFIIARAALRKILAAHLGVSPTEVDFEYSDQGKPSLASNTDLDFNVAHSADKALIACTHGREIGVDIECIRPDIEIDNLAQRFFSLQENQRLQAIPRDLRRRAFFRCWTCKEAYVKAVGKGLPLGLDHFDVSAALENAAMTSTHMEEFAVNEWCLIPFDIDDSYLAALVTMGRGLQIEVHDASELPD